MIAGGDKGCSGGWEMEVTGDLSDRSRELARRGIP